MLNIFVSSSNTTSISNEFNGTTWQPADPQYKINYCNLASSHPNEIIRSVDALQHQWYLPASSYEDYSYYSYFDGFVLGGSVPKYYPLLLYTNPRVSCAQDRIFWPLSNEGKPYFRKFYVIVFTCPQPLPTHPQPSFSFSDLDRSLFRFGHFDIWAVPKSTHIFFCSFIGLHPYPMHS